MHEELYTSLIISLNQRHYYPRIILVCRKIMESSKCIKLFNLDTYLQSNDLTLYGKIVDAGAIPSVRKSSFTLMP